MSFYSVADVREESSGCCSGSTTYLSIGMALPVLLAIVELLGFQKVILHLLKHRREYSTGIMELEFHNFHTIRA